MKKQLLLAFSAALLLGSCAENNMEGPKPTDTQISFKIESSDPIHAPADQFQDGDEISVAALKDSEILKDAIYSYKESNFESSDPIAKKSKGEELAYNAIFPAQENYASEFTFDVQTNQSDAEEYALSDLLVASVEPTADMQPALVFQHKLSSIVFNFKLLNGSVIAPEEVALSAKTSVSCNINDGSYVAAGENNSVIAASNVDVYKAIIAPQTISSDETFISFSYNEDTYTVSLPEDVVFESSYQYTYEFVCNKNDKSVSAKLIDASIENWGKNLLVYPTEEDKFKATLVAATESDIVVDIDMGSYEGIYYIGLASGDDYSGNAEELAESLIYAEVNEYETDLTVVDDVWLFNTEGEKSLDAGWNIFSDSKYVVIAFGVDAAGNILTNVASIEVTTAPVEQVGTIDIEIGEIGEDYIKVKATPSSGVGSYIYGVASTEYFLDEVDGFGGDAKAYAQAIISAYTGNSLDFASPDGIYVLSGECEFDVSKLWRVGANEDYTVFVFGVTDQGFINTPITQESVKTLETAPLSDVTSDFKAEFVSSTETDIILNVDKGSWEGNYFVGLTPMSEYVGDPNEFALALMDDEINFFETDLTIVDNKWVFFDSGEISLDPGNKIYANNEYAIVVFGMDKKGNILTNVVYIEAKSASPEVAGSIAIEVKEVSYNSITISATPSQEVSSYIYGAIPTSMYGEDLNNDPVAAANAIINAYASFYIEVTEPDDIYVFGGASDVDVSEFWSIEPETDYSIFVFGASVGLAICTDITVVEATSLPEPPVEFLDGHIDITNLTVVDEFTITYDATPTADIWHYFTTAILDMDLEQAFDNDVNEAAYAAIQSELEYGTDFSEADDFYVFEGPKTGLNLCDAWFIDPELDYTMLTFAVDDRGNIVSEVTCNKFTSAPSSGEAYYAPKAARTIKEPALRCVINNYIQDEEFGGKDITIAPTKNTSTPKSSSKQIDPNLVQSYRSLIKR